MNEWLDTLTDKQIRALSCQCHRSNWATGRIEELRTELQTNESANQIFQDTYGKAASVQE